MTTPRAVAGGEATPLLVLHAAAGGATGFGHVARGSAIVDAARRRGWQAELLVEAPQRSEVAGRTPVDAALVTSRTAALAHRRRSVAAHEGPTVLACDLPERQIAKDANAAADGFDLTVLLNGDPSNPAPADVVFLRGRPSDQPVQARCVAFGREFEVIRPEVEALRPTQPWNGPRVNRVLVSFGGTDPGHQTEKIATALAGRPVPETLLVAGPSFGQPRVEELRRLAQPPLSLVVDPDSLPELMLDADLVVSMGGQSLLEALHLGRPVAVIRWGPLIDVAEVAVEQGFAADLGTADTASASLRDLVRQPQGLAVLADRGWRTIDGAGARRCMHTIWQCLMTKEPDGESITPNARTVTPTS